MVDLTAQPGSRPAAPWQQINWWLMLIPLVGVAVSIVISRIDDQWFQTLQVTLEVPAPFMIGFASVVYLARTFWQRNVLFLLLGVLTLAMTLREVHDLPGLAFIGKGIYVTLGVVVACAVVWRDRVWKHLSCDWRHTSWLMATFFAYFVALLIQRRAFRVVPGEHHIHRSLEECAETVAHGMFIVTCLTASWRKPSRCRGQGR